MSFLLVVLMALSSLSPPAEGACLTDFAALSPDDPQGIRLTAETYRSLLDELGGGLTPESLASMAEKEHPFDVPEQEGYDAITLRKRLKDFESMLEKKGWQTPAHLQAMREVLKARAGDVTESQKQLSHAIVGNSWSSYDRELSFPFMRELLPTADGRYVAAVNTSENPAIVMVLDTKSQELKTYPMSGVLVENMPAVIAQDGSAIGLRRLLSPHFVIPMVEGVPQAGKATMVQPKKSITPKGGVFLSGLNPMYLVDAVAGEGVVVQLTQFYRGNRRPGTEGQYEGFAYSSVGTGQHAAFVRRDRDSNQVTVEWAKVSLTGEIETVAKHPLHENPHQRVEYQYKVVANQAGKVLTWFNNAKDRGTGAMVFVPGAAAPIDLLPGQKLDKQFIGAAALHPTEPIAAISIRDGSSIWVQVTNLDTGKTGKFPMPFSPTSLTFDGKGKGLYAAQDSGKTLRVINYRIGLD